MNYMLLIYQEGEPVQAPPIEGVPGCAMAIVDRLTETGQYVAAGVLQPVVSATSVQLRQGRRLVTDGPFAETREQLAGYLIIEANHLDEAIAIAAQHPVAATGTIEIRPVTVIASRTPPALTAND